MKNIAMLMIVLLVFGWMLAGQAREPDMPDRYSLHLVLAGDTLWGISRQYMPEVDPRIGIEWIKEVNSMRKDCMIHPGDILNVPAADGPLVEPLGPEYSSPEAAQAANRAVERLLQEIRPKPASRAAETKIMTVEATAYCACKSCTGKGENHPAYGITASGEKVRPGVVAVDPKIIPLGTRIWVEGYGLAAALDTGGAIKGRRIDVYFPSHEEAKKWGRKTVKIRILEVNQ